MAKERGERAKSECVGMRLLALAVVGVFFSRYSTGITQRPVKKYVGSISGNDPLLVVCSPKWHDIWILTML